MLVSGVLAVGGEACKPCLRDPRPRASGNLLPSGEPKPGMPSGHCLVAVTLLVCAPVFYAILASAHLFQQQSGRAFLSEHCNCRAQHI